MSIIPYRKDTRNPEIQERNRLKSLPTTPFLPTVSLLLFLTIIIGVMLVLVLYIIENLVVVVSYGHMHAGRSPKDLLDLLFEDGEFLSEQIR